MAVGEREAEEKEYYRATLVRVVLVTTGLAGCFLFYLCRNVYYRSYFQSLSLPTTLFTHTSSLPHWLTTRLTTSLVNGLDDIQNENTYCTEVVSRFSDMYDTLHLRACIAYGLLPRMAF